MTCTLLSGCMAGENMGMGHGKSVRAYIQALPSEQSSPSPNQPRKASRASGTKAKGDMMSFMSVLGLAIHGSTVSLWLCSKHVNMVPHAFISSPDHLEQWRNISMIFGNILNSVQQHTLNIPIIGCKKANIYSEGLSAWCYMVQ